VAERLLTAIDIEQFSNEMRGRRRAQLKRR
jgi:hypothetical protein